MHLDCYGIPTGAAAVQNPISLSNYSYSWEDVAGNSYGTDTIAENLAAGTYVLFAHYSDSLGTYPGCTKTDSIIEIEMTALVVTLLEPFFRVFSQRMLEQENLGLKQRCEARAC